MPIRITGLNSGLDTESIISALVSSYNYKTQKYEKAQTKLSWKQDAWKDLNTKIYSLYKNVGNLKLASSYNMRKTTVSNPTIATVTAGSGAVNGSYSLQVTQLAKAGYLTGAEVKNQKDSSKAVTSSTTLGELGLEGEGSFQIKVGNGEAKNITLGSDKKISDVLTELRNAGVNASFDEKNKRFFVSAKESGEANDFTLTAESNNGKELLNILGLNTEDSVNYEELAQYAGITVDDVNAINKAKAEYEEAQKKLIEIQNRGDQAKQNLDASFETLKTLADKLKDKKIENVDIEDFSLTEQEKQALQDFGISTEAEDGKMVIKEEAWTEFTTSLTTSLTTKNTLDTYKEDYGEDIVEKTSNMSETEISNFVKAANGQYVDGATRVKGSDAEIYVNGARYTGDSNTFTVNGLTITATGVTGEYSPYETNAITVGVSTDTQGIYDKVKDFLSQYNSIINEMTKLYNSDSAKGYEPLTDEEKDAMSDAEVEKWESKIKNSILRRDDTLSGLISTMTNAMSKGVNVDFDGDGKGDGKTYYLADFGIQTLGFLNAPKNEQNAYHIDGDEDDPNTSGKTDKLMAALNEDPDTVVTFMKQLSEQLYNAIDTKMKSTTLSSVYTVYNDKEMASEYSDYTSTIRKWQERLEQQEEYYYNKFAKMEEAMAKLNSQSSSMSGFFGM